MNRRKFLGSAIAVGAGSTIAGPLAAAEQLVAHRPPVVRRPQLNVALLDNVQNDMGAILNRFAQRKHSPADFRAMQFHIQTAVAELKAKNADASFKEHAVLTLQGGHAKNSLFTANGAAHVVHDYTVKYTSRITTADLEKKFNHVLALDPSLPARQHIQAVNTHLRSTEINGLTAGLSKLGDLFGQMAASSATTTSPPTLSTRPRANDTTDGYGNDDGGDDGGDFGDGGSEGDGGGGGGEGYTGEGGEGGNTPMQGGFCDQLTFYLGWVGLAATELAIMCALPEPALVVICPAAAILGIIAGILAGIQFLFC